MSVFILFGDGEFYNPVVIECVVAVFEKMDDDRMS